MAQVNNEPRFLSELTEEEEMDVDKDAEEETPHHDWDCSQIYEEEKDDREQEAFKTPLALRKYGKDTVAMQQSEDDSSIEIEDVQTQKRGGEGAGKGYVHEGKG